MIEEKGNCRVCEDQYIPVKDKCLKNNTKGCLKINKNGNCDSCNIFTGYFAVDNVTGQEEGG